MGLFDDVPLNRREFIKAILKGGVAVSSLPLALKLLGILEEPAYAELVQKMLVPHSRPLDNNRVQCLVCPFNCILKIKERSQCFTKQNDDGKLFTYAYHNPCIISVDPVEKMPLHHYLPGSQTLTLAIGGCNLHCLYCQNWQQSQKKPDELKMAAKMDKDETLSALKKKELKILAFNYTEPVVMLEWIIELSKFVRPKGYKVVIGTALYINAEPLKALLDAVDGVVVGLKGFTEEFYKKVTGGTLKPVLDGLVKVKEEKKHLEVVNLVVPTYNDKEEDIKRMCEWFVKNLGAETPLHFSRFEPMYKLQNLPRTPLKTLETAHKMAKDCGIKFVYIDNLAPHPANDTYCPKCNKPLIKRVGLRILENSLKEGKCSQCGESIPGVWR
ncbi:MAG: AmmeMemoRadiSam system radical SAM enzyme [Planctomycetota bacterium]|nr:AmmeMemoRadiSam system radical SAM enzyme [Planctomycetota bacterium]